MLLSQIYYVTDQMDIAKADISIQNDTITAIGRLCAAPGEEVIDGTGLLLLPGLCNTHCHVPMTLLRGQSDHLPLDQWLQSQIFPAENHLTKEAVYYGALLGIAEMLSCGVTSFDDMYYFSDAVCQAVVESGICANVAMDGFAFDPALQNRFSISLEELEDFYLRNHDRCPQRLTIDFCIHAEYTTTPERCVALIGLAKKYQARVQLHLAETASEVEGCLLRHQKTPVRYFESLGLFDLPVTAAHCVHLTDEDRSILAKNRVFVSHCPSSNCKLGSGIADLSALRQAGVLVTLGTDGASSNDSLNLLGDLRLSCLLQKALHQDPTVFTAKDALQMATSTGFHAQGRMDSGVIQVGKRADLFALRLTDENMAPANQLLQTAVYAANPKNVAFTMVHGQILYRDGAFLTIDVPTVQQKVTEFAQQLF